MTNDMKRINVVLPLRTIDRIDSLQARTNASSNTEVIRSAILVYDAIAKSLEQGGRFIAQMPDGSNRIFEFAIDVSLEGLETLSLRGNAQAFTARAMDDALQSHAALARAGMKSKGRKNDATY